MNMEMRQLQTLLILVYPTTAGFQDNCYRKVDRLVAKKLIKRSLAIFQLAIALAIASLLSQFALNLQLCGQLASQLSLLATSLLHTSYSQHVCHLNVQNVLVATQLIATPKLHYVAKIDAQMYIHTSIVITLVCELTTTSYHTTTAIQLSQLMLTKLHNVSKFSNADCKLLQSNQFS